MATGSSYSQLAFSFRLGLSTVSNLLIETMSAIWKNLQPIHMPVPSEQDFINISEQFYTNWGFPHVIGAIDGRHIRIKKPPNSGSLYYNYKKFFSIVLQAVVDASNKYIIIDVGGYGHQSDGGKFQSSFLYRALLQKKIKIPSPNTSQNCETPLPFYFIADGAYPLLENLMKPYRINNSTERKNLFNKRLSRARAVVECAFGITCQKWGIFYTTIQSSPEVVSLVVQATCVLHNILIDLERNQTTVRPKEIHIDEALVPGSDDEGSYHVLEKGKAEEIRKEIIKYFLSNI